MAKNLKNKTDRSQIDLNYANRQTYILRMWCIDQREGVNWQSSLEIPETGIRIGFASLEELFDYLINLTSTRIE